MLSPSSSQMSLPPIEAACADAVMVSSKCSVPLSIASKTSKSVITFVIDAQGRRSCVFFSKRILPESASIRIAEGAETLSSSSAKAGQTGKISRDIARKKEIKAFFINKTPRSMI